MRSVLRNLFLCTGLPDGFIPDGALVLEGSRIAWVGPVAAMPEQPEGTAERDLGGRVVIPGLINTHAHGGMSLHRGCCDEGDLFQWAAALAPTTAHLTLEDNRWGSAIAVAEMLRNGVTTVCDCTRFGAGIFGEVASGMGMRSLSGALANSPSLRSAGRPNWPLALEETLEAMRAQSGNGLCRHYLGAHSPYNCTPELLREVKDAAERHGLPFVIHLAENRRETEMIIERHGTTPLRHLHRLGLLDRNSILAHCVWLDEEELDLLAASGAGVAHNPISNAKLASGIAPVKAMRARRVPVGLGTDGMLSNNAQDIFAEMKFGVLLARATSLDGYALTAADAFAMATIEGARVLGWDDEIGSLEAGKQADLVVLDLDHPLGLTPHRVLSDLVFRAGPQHVREVLVAGETVFVDGRLLRVDEAALRARISRLYCEALPA
ncbi:amidohydrolase family protein [Roseomonas sp. AR75]|uniref:amidohydrolase family protein n=1 Tax=Roseomonas sp. AR75 TaxID=2562311 RepID=UPI0010C09447|nr:amidohydrolase [Roseomonas sp. AR75]